MRLIFAGTPPFAATALSALHRAGHDLALVLTQPDRRAGRGMQLTPSAVANEAERLELTLRKPSSLKDMDTQMLLRDQAPDVMVVAAYGLLLPQAVLDIPPWGCINIHGSLLPRWRGAAPIQRAIEAGDAKTGISIMQMDAGLDTGAILLKKEMPIAVADSSATLFEKLTLLGADAIVEALAALSSLVTVPQPAEGVTYAKKIEKSEARIDWTQPAPTIERRLRAFDPFPGCESRLNGESLKIWRAEIVPCRDARPPGTVTEADNAIVVRCGEDALRLTVVQKHGGKRMPIEQFLLGVALGEGARFS